MPYEKLQEVVSGDAPAGVDMSQIDRSKLEIHLSDAEFVQALGVSRDEFAALPHWKRTEKKKAAKLV